jgi:integrase
MGKTKTQGVYTRTDSRFYWIAYQDVTGKVIRQSSGTTNHKEAQEILARKRQIVLEGKQPEVKKVRHYTFAELAEVYLKWAERQKAIVTKARKIKQLVDEFGAYPLRRFNTLQLEQFQSERLKKNKPATVNRLVATLKHMFTKAVEWEMVEEEILKKVRRVKLLKENNGRLRYLSAENSEALLRACDAHLRPLVVLALHTGMRKEEILSLRWEENIDLTHGFILLTKTKNGDRREVPINGVVRECLWDQVRRLDVPYVF